MEKDLVWLPRDLADKVKALEDPIKQGKAVIEYIEDSKRAVKYTLDGLEDDIVRYKGQMANMQIEFKKAKEEQLDANYVLWEKYEDEIAKVKVRVRVVTDLLVPVKKDLDQLNARLKDIDVYRLKEAFSLIKELTQILNHDSKTGDIIRFLFDNYKRPNETT